MRFRDAIDAYFDDMRVAGRITSDRSEVSYRATLSRHAEDVGNRDPATTNRVDVKRTLTRWSNPNTQRLCRSHLVSFYRWAMEEGLRKDNPAEQTRRPRKRPAEVYRLTREEAVLMLLACRDRRERWTIYLGICAGLRNQELRGLRGLHFLRPGVTLVSADIGKGGRGRWIPVISELEPVVKEIRAEVGRDEYVLPAQRWRDPGMNREQHTLAKRPSSSQALRSLVKRVAQRAGISGNVHPHTLRHAFADHIMRGTGDIRTAQALLGHATVATTEAYLSAPALDDLAAAVANIRLQPERPFSPVGVWAANPVEATTGIEPV